MTVQPPLQVDFWHRRQLNIGFSAVSLAHFVRLCLITTPIEFDKFIFRRSS
jgi:hypothetical protein